MPTLFLYISTVLIWGSTWYAITLQLGNVAPEVSVAYRFAIAALLLLLFCWVRKKQLRYSVREHIWMAVQGFFLFCSNYVIFYIATAHLTSGLVSVVFSTIVFWNILFTRFIFGTPVSKRVLVGTALGIFGLALVFWPEVTGLNRSGSADYGLILCMIATVLASLGNIASVHNQNKALPVLQTNAFGMAYGAILTALYAWSSGLEFTWDTSMPYLASLLYLAVFGSILAFGAYLTLLGRIGAGQAAYSAVLFPIVALTLSVFLENYTFTALAGLGVILVLGGNILALTKAKAFTKPCPQPPQDGPKDAQTTPVLSLKSE
ncbi:MAG: EamA family transporter [Magnetovibrio sp.]|nr:EamA family transporter [Magnetovibrio sp.]